MRSHLVITEDMWCSPMIPAALLRVFTSCVITSSTQVFLLSDIMTASTRHDGGYLNTTRASYNDRKTHRKESVLFIAALTFKSGQMMKHEKKITILETSAF